MTMTNPRLRQTEPELIVRRLGHRDYRPVWHAMQSFTRQRSADTADELWLVEHPPVYTLGRAGKIEHLLARTPVPVIHVDRGGQITYHGPGQIVAYLLIDLQRLGVGVRDFVRRIEGAVIDLLADYGITATARRDAPGVYVDGRKIAALGLRVRRGCCYHGVSLNVAMDLQPFRAINPCGYPALEVTQLADLAGPVDIAGVSAEMVRKLKGRLGYAGRDRSIEGAIPESAGICDPQSAITP